MQVIVESEGCRAKIDTHTKVAYVSDVFVPIPKRGQGLGRAIVENAVAVCKTLGITRIVMHTDNEAMFHILETMDFVHSATERHYQWDA